MGLTQLFSPQNNRTLVHIFHFISPMTASARKHSFFSAAALRMRIRVSHSRDSEGYASSSPITRTRTGISPAPIAAIRSQSARHSSPFKILDGSIENARARRMIKDARPVQPSKFAIYTFTVCLIAAVIFLSSDKPNICSVFVCENIIAQMFGFVNSFYKKIFASFFVCLKHRKNLRIYPNYSKNTADIASLGIKNPPRGDRLTLPTAGPSGRQERLNC